MLYETTAAASGQAAPSTTLPRRPTFYVNGAGMAPGHLAPMLLDDGRWSVIRHGQARDLFPLTNCENPAWVCWPRREGAEAFINCFGNDWPHWGGGAA